MTLAGANLAGEVVAEESREESKSIDFLSLISLPQDSAPKNSLAAMLEMVRSQVSAELSEEEDDEVEEPEPATTGVKGAGTDGTQKRPRSGCSQAELEKIRRERNRLHARKTRQRKKKMMQEMENIVRVLEDEVKELRAAKTSAVSSSFCPSVAMSALSSAGDLLVGVRRRALGCEDAPVAESTAVKRRCSIVSSVASSRSSSLLSVRSATSVNGMDDLILRAVLGCGGDGGEQRGGDRDRDRDRERRKLRGSSGNASASELHCDSADSATSLDDERLGYRQASPSPQPKPLELRTSLSFVTIDSLLQLSNNNDSNNSNNSNNCRPLVPVKRTRDEDSCEAQASKFANMGYVFVESSSGGSDRDTVQVSQIQGAYSAIHEDSPSF